MTLSLDGQIRRTIDDRLCDVHLLVKDGHLGNKNGGAVQATSPKPKFKMTKEEMLQFNDDCEMAAKQCPQWKGGSVDDRVILLKQIKAKDLVQIWKDCDVLWKSGYHEGLTADASLVFKEFKTYKAKLRVWKDEQR